MWRRPASLCAALLLAGCAGPAVGPRAEGRQPIEKASVAAAPRLGTSGIYALEQELDFNVLDHVVLDPEEGTVHLLGHYDPAYAGPPIPYLQHLAVLIESPDPEFSLRWTERSEGQVKELFRKTADPKEQARLRDTWGTLFRGTALTENARLILPAMGIHPGRNGQGPGSLGITVRKGPDDAFFAVASVAPGSAAERAGLKIGDHPWMFNKRGFNTQLEFDQMVRRAGAGASVPIDVSREAGRDKFEIVATLDAAPGDPWAGFSKQTCIEEFFRVTGRKEAADLFEHVDLVERTGSCSEDDRYIIMIGMINNLGLLDLHNKIMEQKWGGQIDQKEAQRRLEHAACERFDAVLGLTEKPFAAAFARTGTFSAAVDAADPALMALQATCIDEIFARPEGVRIPTPLIQSAFGLAFEARPDFNRLGADTQLARAMCEADFLFKEMLHADGLAKRIPGFQTLYAFGQAHPDWGGLETGNYHTWISIDRLDQAESKDGCTLATRGASMRINHRQYAPGPDKIDLPAVPGGHDELLTGLYDELSRVFPALHEVRECAKLGGAAHWIRARKPDLRLPKGGRRAWATPRSVPGSVHMFAKHAGMGGHAVWLTTSAEGGVSLVAPGGAAPLDRNLADFRERMKGSRPPAPPRLRGPEGAPRPAPGRARGETPRPGPAAWALLPERPRRPARAAEGPCRCGGEGCHCLRPMLCGGTTACPCGGVDCRCPKACKFAGVTACCFGSHADGAQQRCQSTCDCKAAAGQCGCSVSCGCDRRTPRPQALGFLVLETPATTARADREREALEEVRDVLGRAIATPAPDQPPPDLRRVNHVFSLGAEATLTRTAHRALGRIREAEARAVLAGEDTTPAGSATPIEALEARLEKAADLDSAGAMKEYAAISTELMKQPGAVSKGDVAGLDRLRGASLALADAETALAQALAQEPEQARKTLQPVLDALGRELRNEGKDGNSAAESETLSARASGGDATGIDGEWKGGYMGEVVLNRGHGTFTARWGEGPGKLTYHATGERSFEGTWWEGEKLQGTLIFTLSGDGRTIKGKWKVDEGYGTGRSGKWGYLRWTRKR